MKKILTVLLSALFLTFGSLSFTACKKERPKDDGIIHVESVEINGEKERTLQVGESVLIEYTVLPENALTKAVKITVSNEQILGIQNNRITALKTGEATVTVKSVDGNKSDSISITVGEVIISESNKYTAEILPERDARIDFVADSSVSPGDAASVTVKQNGTVISRNPVTVDYGGNASCLISDMAITKAGKYDFEVAFPGNPSAAITEVWLSDVEQRFYVIEEEKWSASAAPEKGGWEASDQHAMLKEDQVIVATGADTFGGVGLNVTLNNEQAPFIRFRVKNLTKAKWAAKVLGTVEVDGKTVYIGADSRIVEEIEDMEATIDLRQMVVKIIETPFDLVGTGEFLTLGDISGDYNLTLQLYIIGTNGARDGSVEMRDVEIFRTNGEKRMLVRTDKYVPLESVSVSDVTLNVGESTVVLPQYSGADGGKPSYRDITYVSLNESKVTVSPNGEVKAMGGGNAIVEIRRYDGQKVGEFTVTVKVPVTEITVESSSMALETGKTFDLSTAIGILPENATDKRVTYRSETPSVASVSDTGLITAVAEGQTVIEIVSVQDPLKKATVTVYVSKAIVSATGVTLNNSALPLKIGESATLNATITPSNATVQMIVWESDNERAAVVDQDGKVQAVGVGTATIKAKVDGTEIGATCLVTVTQAFRYTAQENFASDLLYITLSGTEDGDVLSLNFRSETNEFTAETVVGGNLAAVFVGNIPQFVVGSYRLTASLKRNGNEVNGFGFNSVVQYEILCDGLNGSWVSDWGATVSQDGSMFSAEAMGCIKQVGISFEGQEDVKMIVFANSFSSKSENGMYAVKFTVSGQGEVTVGGRDLTLAYGEVIDLYEKGFMATGQNSVQLNLIVQNGSVEFGALLFVKGGTALPTE